MKPNNFLGATSLNDGAIFVTESGTIAERTGIVYAKNEQYPNSIDTLFIDEYGEILEISDNNAYSAIIGHKGDTVRLRDLSIAFRDTDDIDSVLSEARRYFTIDLSDLIDTVVLSFDTRVQGRYHARMDIKTKCFPCIGKKFFDLTTEDFKIDDGRKESWSIKESIIPMLRLYSELIGKRVNVEMYFSKDIWSDEDKIEERNKEIFRLEEMFLPRLRRYINEELDKAIEERKKGEMLCDEYEKTTKANEERFKSKFDLDPNLM